ncbi:MAG TPA: agmatinase [Solirubrobacterales bacterium]
MSKRIHQPPDALQAPRFTGPRTFARLPLVESRGDLSVDITDKSPQPLADVDCAVIGLPWDGGTSFRPGARFGPEAIRSASTLLRPYNAAQGTQVFGALSVIDHGDAPTVPGYIEDTLERIERFVAPIAAAGVVPLAMGGDHSVTLAELRALAAAHGPLGLLHLDAHADLWDSYNERPLSHGTFARRAIEEGVVEAGRTLQAGLRGPLYSPEDVEVGRELGVTQIPCEELLELGAEEFAQRARETLGEGPAFLSFDVDFLDPAFCPATGTPEVGGPSGREALALLRALRGVRFAGFDVVEVAPPYDGPGQATALFAANVLYEMLTLVALARS